MATELLIPAKKFRRLLDYMERMGLDTNALLQGTGLAKTNLKSMAADALLPGSDYSRMYKNSVAQMQSLRHPIPWAAGLGSEAFELMCCSIISCRSLGEALARAERFDKLVYPMIGYRVTTRQTTAGAEVHYHVHIDPEDGVFAPQDWDRSEYLETVARASGLMIWYGLCGWLIGRSLELDSVHIAAPYVSDAYRDSLQRVFNCEMHFDAAENKFCLAADYLDRRLVHNSESLQAFLDNAVFELIALNQKPSSTSAAIRSLIKLDFAEAMPSFEQMAENLHMSESSLRRRLLKENNSYQNIKDQVRCEIALQHLRQTDTKISDLAALLGFTEPSSFVRSFRGWMGVTPKAYRDGLRVS